MKNFIKYLILICIYNSILFYGYSYGLNVILFMIPLSIYLICVLNKTNKVINKKAFILLIPIMLLSISYLIYDNAFFKHTNMFVITLLLTFLYIYSINPTFNIVNLIKEVLSVISEPLGVIEKFYKEVGNTITNTFKITEKTKQRTKSYLIIIPVVALVLILLSSADEIFGNIFNKIFKIFENINIYNLGFRIIYIIALFTYLGVVTYFILNKYEKHEYKKDDFKVDNYTIKTLLTILNAIYIVFDIIQIKSLMLHQVSSNINYAEYARSGFFQLLFISILNLAIVLISKRSVEDTKYNKISGLVMVFLTLIIIISSFLRMNMYESVYGYTLLRLLVYISLITETILLVPTIIYIIKPETKILRYYMIIIISIYTITSLLPINYVIAKRNINKYYKDGKIDIKYLENYSSDNIGLLVNLKDNTKDEKIKNSLTNYFTRYSSRLRIKGFQDYNLSKNKAIKLISKYKNNSIDIKWVDL